MAIIHLWDGIDINLISFVIGKIDISDNREIITKFVGISNVGIIDMNHD